MEFDGTKFSPPSQVLAGSIVPDAPLNFSGEISPDFVNGGDASILSRVSQQLWILLRRAVAGAPRNQISGGAESAACVAPAIALMGRDLRDRLPSMVH